MHGRLAKPSWLAQVGSKWWLAHQKLAPHRQPKKHKLHGSHLSCETDTPQTDTMFRIFSIFGFFVDVSGVAIFLEMNWSYGRKNRRSKHTERMQEKLEGLDCMRKHWLLQHNTETSNELAAVMIKQILLPGLRTSECCFLCEIFGCLWLCTLYKQRTVGLAISIFREIGYINQLNTSEPINDFGVQQTSDAANDF